MRKLLTFILLVLWTPPAFARAIETYPDSIPFAPAVNYEAGAYPISVFCGDLDGDGDLDLAVANAWSDNVSILKNNGDGTFQPKVDYGAGSVPTSVFCADLDGDLDLDLAVTNSDSNSVSILKNNGDGTFQPKVDYATGVEPYFVFGADLDGDGDFDLAVANWGSVTVSILWNNGDGTFQPAGECLAGWDPTSVFCADLDGDWDFDLAVTVGGDNTVSILENNGDGTFQSPVYYPGGEAPSSVFGADLDGDEDMDLAVAHMGSKNVSILKNNGDGTFQSKVDYGADYSWSVFCADLDGDLDLDLAVANVGSAVNPGRTVSILKNNGDGTLQPKVDYGTGYAPISAFCGDLDGDGDFDLAVANCQSNNVSILINLSEVPANQPPNPFSLLWPTDGDSVSAPVSLDWQTPYDPNFGDQVRYDLYLSTSMAFSPDSTVIYSNLIISQRTDTLDQNTYYWKVKAQDNWGAERWSSESWSFVVLDTLLTRFSANPTSGIAPLSVNFTDRSIGKPTVWNWDFGDGSGDTVQNPMHTYSDTGYFDVKLVVSNQQGTDSLVKPDYIKVRQFLRGDPNGDGVIDVVDVVYLLNYVYIGGPAPQPLKSGDANCDKLVNIVDVVNLINYLFRRMQLPC
jgi:PKD repeat protein